MDLTPVDCCDAALRWPFESEPIDLWDREDLRSGRDTNDCDWDGRVVMLAKSGYGSSYISYRCHVRSCVPCCHVRVDHASDPF